MPALASPTGTSDPRPQGGVQSDFRCPMSVAAVRARGHSKAFRGAVDFAASSQRASQEQLVSLSDLCSPSLVSGHRASRKKHQNSGALDSSWPPRHSPKKLRSLVQGFRAMAAMFGHRCGQTRAGRARGRPSSTSRRPAPNSVLPGGEALT